MADIGFLFKRDGKHEKNNKQVYIMYSVFHFSYETYEQFNDFFHRVVSNTSSSVTMLFFFPLSVWEGEGEGE